MCGSRFMVWAAVCMCVCVTLCGGGGGGASGVGPRGVGVTGRVGQQGDHSRPSPLLTCHVQLLKTLPSLEATSVSSSALYSLAFQGLDHAEVRACIT